MRNNSYRSGPRRSGALIGLAALAALLVLGLVVYLVLAPMRPDKGRDSVAVGGLAPTTTVLPPSTQAPGTTRATTTTTAALVTSTAFPTTTTIPPLDMGALAPGTIIQEEQIDWSHLQQYFVSYEIADGDAVFARINGRSYRENPSIKLADLRYMKLLHYNFHQEVQVGELIVNTALVADFQEIFQTLLAARYEIESVYLVDNYWTGTGSGSDTASIDVNNTSCFNYRLIAGGSTLSNHAYGRAIDINPQQNPYVTFPKGRPYTYHDNAQQYIDRSTGLPHLITHDDLCYQVFTAHGFAWGGDWDSPKDYQHFEKEG